MFCSLKSKFYFCINIERKVIINKLQNLKIMKAITIESVNYLGNDKSRNFNAKVLYRKNDKLNLAHIYIDYFNESVYIPKQSKECKVLSGLNEAIQYKNLLSNRLI